MIIYIDDTVAEYLNHNQLKPNHEMMFSALAVSYNKGKCVLFGDVDSIKALIAALGKPIDGIYKEVLSKYSENGAIARWTKQVLVITYRNSKDSVSSLPSIFREKAELLYIETAASMNWEAGTCLLGENLSDCQFYEYIGRYYARENKIRNVRIAFHREQGGGSSISSVLQKCVVDDAIFTLCLTDADLKHEATKEYGNPRLGGTYKSCARIVKQLIKAGFETRFYFDHICAHEIENLVPLSLMKRVGNEVCVSDGIKILEELTKINDGRPVLFYDLKNGITTNETTSCGKYWNSVFAQTSVYNDDNRYKAVACEHFLERINDYIDSNGLICVTLDSYLDHIWEELGRIIFTWGCSSQPMRA